MDVSGSRAASCDALQVLRGVDVHGIHEVWPFPSLKFCPSVVRVQASALQYYRPCVARPYIVQACREQTLSVFITGTDKPALRGCATPIIRFTGAGFCTPSAFWLAVQNFPSGGGLKVINGMLWLCVCRHRD